MLFATLSRRSSLQLSTILVACKDRMRDLNIRHFYKRCTLLDANKNVSAQVFADIYYRIFNQYRSFSSDSNDKLIITACIKDMLFLRLTNS
ncbi:MAG: hypothetical protein ACI840_000688 [Ulvibacter sp.]|jgi:hypothetical protein